MNRKKRERGERKKGKRLKKEGKRNE